MVLLILALQKITSDHLICLVSSIGTEFIASYNNVFLFKNNIQFILKKLIIFQNKFFVCIYSYYFFVCICKNISILFLLFLKFHCKIYLMKNISDNLICLIFSIGTKIIKSYSNVFFLFKNNVQFISAKLAKLLNIFCSYIYPCYFFECIYKKISIIFF